LFLQIYQLVDGHQMERYLELLVVLAVLLFQNLLDSLRHELERPVELQSTAELLLQLVDVERSQTRIAKSRRARQSGVRHDKVGRGRHQHQHRDAMTIFVD